jgi:hypothetical protein
LGLIGFVWVCFGFVFSEAESAVFFPVEIAVLRLAQINMIEK